MPYQLDMKDEDYSTYKNTKWELLPEVWTLFRIEWIEFKQGPNGKYFSWKLRVEEGPLTGRLIWVNTTAIKGKRWLLQQALDALGIEKVDGQYSLEPNIIVGTLISGLVKTEKRPSKDDRSVVNRFRSVKEHTQPPPPNVK